MTWLRYLVDHRILDRITSTTSTSVDQPAPPAAATSQEQQQPKVYSEAEVAVMRRQNSLLQVLVLIFLVLALSLIVTLVLTYRPAKPPGGGGGDCTSNEFPASTSAAALQLRTASLVGSLVNASSVKMRCKSAMLFATTNSSSAPADLADCIYFRGSTFLWADKCTGVPKPGYSHFAVRPWLHMCQLRGKPVCRNTSEVVVNGTGTPLKSCQPLNVYCGQRVSSADLRVHVTSWAKLDKLDGEMDDGVEEMTGPAFFFINLKDEPSLCLTCPQSEANYVYLKNCTGAAGGGEGDDAIDDEQLFYLSGTGVEHT